MIISASRRTDIPAFYGEWFMNRIYEGFVHVRNPMNRNQISTITLSPDSVDCIVFWTKNPISIIDRLDELDNLGYAYYVQFTLNPYDDAIEKGIPRKRRIIDLFHRLSDKIGPERVLWRYDPIIFTKDMDCTFHLDRFSSLAEQLEGYTDRCTISFLDVYRKITKRIRHLDSIKPDDRLLSRFASQLADIAVTHHLKIYTCSEPIDLSEYGIAHGACIDGLLIERLTGKSIPKRKDASQRPHCRCVRSRDIGAYDTCLYDCIYCYANSTRDKTGEPKLFHNPKSTLL